MFRDGELARKEERVSPKRDRAKPTKKHCPEMLREEAWCAPEPGSRGTVQSGLSIPQGEFSLM